MRLLLSDGTGIALENYNKGYATVNGNTVDSVSFTVIKTTLEKVKTLFASGDNLSVLHVYTDDNILTDTFNGYEIRKSIALGTNDEEFIVTLAKSSEVNEQLSAIQKELSEVRTLLKNISTIQTETGETISSINTELENVTKTTNSHTTKIEKITESVNSCISSCKTSELSASNNDIAVKKLGDSVAVIADAVNQMKEKVSQVSDSIEETNRASYSARANVSKALSDIEGKKMEIDTINAQQEEVFSRLKNNEKLVADHGAKVSTLSQNVQASSLKVEQFSEKLSTVARAASDASNNVEELSKGVSEIGEKIEQTNTALDDLSGKTEEISQNSENLSVRVSKLEPIEDISTLSLEDAKKYRVQESVNELNTWLLEHPITSDCHGGKSAQYSITSDKQSYLQAMIMMTTTAQQKGISYQPSWNTTGEACTYDWTLEELQQLAIEIEATVRPLISHQQALEKDILAAESMDQLKAIVISYAGIDPNPISV